MPVNSPLRIQRKGTPFFIFIMAVLIDNVGIKGVSSVNKLQAKKVVSFL